jgi:hypothetical protein
MSRRVAIPAIQGVQDPAVVQILSAMKERIERSGGERVRMAKIAVIGGAATTNDIINKLNEIIGRVNE